VTLGRLHADEVEIDASLARGLLREQMPEFSALPLLRVVSGGTENAVFRLGDELAVRMPMTPGAVGGLLKEVRWLPVLAGHLSLDVPEVLAVGAPAERYPFPWTVVRWLTGEEALTGRIESMGEVAAGLGRFVAELQGIDMTGAPPPGSEGFVRGLPLDSSTPTSSPGMFSCGTAASPACLTSAQWQPVTRHTTSLRLGTCSTVPAALPSARSSRPMTRRAGAPAGSSCRGQ